MSYTGSASKCILVQRNYQRWQSLKLQFKLVEVCRGGGGGEQGDPNLPYFAFPVPASKCNGITKGDKGCELQKKIGRVRGGGGGVSWGSRPPAYRTLNSRIPPLFFLGSFLQLFVDCEILIVEA